MTWTVIVAKPAQKQLAKFPAKDQTRIESGLKAMAADPLSDDTLKLEGEKDRWCRRVGSYRLLFSADTAVRSVAVSAIVRCSSSTY